MDKDNTRRGLNGEENAAQQWTDTGAEGVPDDRGAQSAPDFAGAGSVPDDMDMEITAPDMAPGGGTEADAPAAAGGGMKARLPRRATVVDEHGEKIGRVRKGVWYDAQDAELGRFAESEAGGVYLYAQDVRSGYVDGNDNIRTPAGAYVATLRYFNWGILWLLILALLLAAALLGVGIGLSRPAERAPVFFIVEDTDERASWSDMEDIPLFYGDGGYDEIVPGMRGSYRFLFVNENEHSLVFSFDFDEENEYGIDLCFRLKRDGAYIRGEEGYIGPEDLSFADFTIEAQSESLFEVEWYWRDNDPVDTVAGENGAIYRLLIDFAAEVEEEE